MAATTYEEVLGGDWFDQLDSWARQRWTAPPFGTPAFAQWLDRQGLTMREFQATAMYADAVAQRRIVDGAWVDPPAGGVAWQDDQPFRAQVDRIVAVAHTALADLVQSAQDEVARALLDEELGTLILRYVEAGAVAGGVSEEDLTLYAPRRLPDAAEAAEQGLLWAAAGRHLSPAFQSFLWDRKLPRFYVSMGARGHYRPAEHAIVIPDEAGEPGQFQRAVCAYLVTLGEISRSVTYLRNRLAYEAPIVRLVGGGYALQGSWIDAVDGRLTARSSPKLDALVTSGNVITDEEALKFRQQGGHELLLGVAERMIDARVTGIAASWRRVPEQVALYLAVCQGRFVELPPFAVEAP